MTVSLHNKNILLGVCGGIAAYKSAELVRRLQDAGADVRVIMTRGAQEFITPLTFQALSGHRVYRDLLDSEAEAAMGHIELARWADLLLIAPATANCISRLVSGRADDLLCAVYLASSAKKAIAPAMNHIMWSSAATQSNIHLLQQWGCEILGPDTGLQACGEVGEGRLLDIEKLVEASRQLFHTGLLQGLHIMITAGPTHEPIDPVRYITNRSSGRMGYAIAEAAIEQGAKVTLVSGPVSLKQPEHCQLINIETAQQMHHQVMQHIAGQDIFIASAAVADFRVTQPPGQKIKKSRDELTLKLSPNPDILAQVAALDHPPFTLGFAAETENLRDYALQKLSSKKLNMIAANWVAQKDQQDTGFNSEYNALEVFCKETQGCTSLNHARKTELARQLLTLLAKQYYEQTTS